MREHGYFSAKEYADRVAALRHRMEVAGVEVCLLDEIEAMTWISGYGSSLNRWRCVVVPLDAEPFFLIRALDATPCRQRTWIRDIPTYRDWEDPMPVLAASLAERGFRGRPSASTSIPMPCPCVASNRCAARFRKHGSSTWGRSSTS